MERNYFDISPKQLRRKLVQSLKSKGVLQELKSNLRHQLIAELHSKSIESCQNDVSFNDKIAFNLCLEHLQKSGYTYSTSVLLPEAAQQNIEGFSRGDLIKILKLNDLLENQPYRECLMNENKSLIHNISSLIMTMASIVKTDKFCQTGLYYAPFNFDIQLNKINAKYDDQRKFDIEMLKHQFTEKVFHMRNTIEEEVCNNYFRKLEDFKKNTQFEIKKELEIMANEAIKEKQQQLEEAYSIKRSVLEERENRLDEIMAKARETSELNDFLQRRALTAEIEAARTQKERLRQIELDLQRQRKKLQKEYAKRQAQLQSEEERLIESKQEFEAIVRQEVERHRKSDEIEILNRRKDIEVAESQISVEKDALEAKMQHILALQREVTEKSAFFSEMEITDYQTLKMRLNATSNEINTLKGRLKEAFEEIERSRKSASIAIAEKSLLSSVRQENERLRMALERERTERRQERNQLNQNIEEMKAEKDRLENRIRQQDAELSTLRNRLADQRYHAAELPIVDASYSKNSSVVAVEQASLNPTSATIEKARERLKSLEQESARIDESLSRWREELFAPSSSTILRRIYLAGDTLQTGCPGNYSAAAYLTNSSNFANTPPLKNLSFNRSMPFERMTNSVIPNWNNGSSKKERQFEVKPKQTSNTEDQYDLRGENLNGKQNQRTSSSGTESNVSQEKLQPNSVSCSKSAEVLNSNQPKAQTSSMLEKADAIETPNSENNCQEVSESKLNANSLAQNIEEIADEVSIEDVVIPKVNSVQLLYNYSADEESNNKNTEDESEVSSDYNITDLISDTTESSNNDYIHEVINKESNNGGLTRNENKEKINSYSTSSSSSIKCDKTMGHDKIVKEQLDEDIHLEHIELAEEEETSNKLSYSLKSSDSNTRKIDGEVKRSGGIMDGVISSKSEKL